MKLLAASDILHMDFNSTNEKYIKILAENKTISLIDNVDCDVGLVRIDNELSLPYTTCNRSNNSISATVTRSFVVSSFSHYYTYGKETALKFVGSLNVFLKLFIHLIFSFLYILMKVTGDIDKGVFVNNYLLSTCLYPSRKLHEIISKIPDITSLLHQEVAGDKAIIWRSLDTIQHEKLIQSLESNQYCKIFSRRIHYQFVCDTSIWKRSAMRSDRRLWTKLTTSGIDLSSVENDKKTKADNNINNNNDDVNVKQLQPSMLRQFEYIHVDSLSKLGDSDIEIDIALHRMIQLYKMLYIKKYNEANIQFNEAFVSNVICNKLMHVKILREVSSRVIYCVIGFVVMDDMMTTPFFGYDTGAEKELGLYRMASYMVSMSGREMKLIVNASGGAGPFKRQRGAISTAEYILVKFNHLPILEQLPWRFLSISTNLIEMIVEKLKKHV